MADKKISKLNPTTTPAAGDLFVGVDKSVSTASDKNRKYLAEDMPAGFGIRVATAVSITTAGEAILGVTNTAAPRTITLATADARDGKFITIQDESGGAGSNTITIDTEGSELINGAATTTIPTNYGARGLYSDGSNWFIRF